MTANQRDFFPMHNVVVSLDTGTRGAEYYRQILEFLLRSRIRHALTHSPPLMIDYIRQFWATARYDAVVDPPVIRMRLNEVPLVFSRADIVNVLQLGDNVLELGPTEYAFEFRAGAFQRMGYSGDLTKNQWAKSYLYGQWRYMMHIMIVSLSARRSGFDIMGPRLQSAMAALVYNKPYSFSQFFMDEFIQQTQVGGRERFLMYPRFIMMIIQHLLPNLPALPNVVQVPAIGRRLYTDCQHHNVRRPIAERPMETTLFGHLVNPNYIPPANDHFLDDNFY